MQSMKRPKRKKVICREHRRRTRLRLQGFLGHVVPALLGERTVVDRCNFSMINGRDSFQAGLG